MKKEPLIINLKKTQNRRKGFLLVEILLASSIFVLFVTAFAGVFYYGIQSSSFSGDRARATIIAEEGQEAVRSIKNLNFSLLSDGTYGLSYVGGEWVFSGTQDVNGAYTRSVKITTITPNRKEAEVTVTWPQLSGKIGTLTTTTRLTNWKTIIDLGTGLMVNKVVINHGKNKTAADFAPYRVGTATVQLASSTIFPSGTYTVSETVDSNYTQTFSGDCNALGQVTLASGTAKLCTITNEEKLSYITLTSSVTNNGGNKTVSHFAPYKAGSTTVLLNTLTPIDSGAYMITQSSDPNYNVTFTGDCFTNGSITIDSNQSRTCHISNVEVITGNTTQSLPGIMIYGDGSNIPKYRTFDHENNVFSAETGTFVATVGPTWLLRTSPTQHIALAGYYDNTGTLTIMCFDGSNWTKEFEAASGGVGNRHRFDIAFEKTSGDAMVIFSKGQHVFSQLGWRTKAGDTACGAGWAAETLLDPLRTSNDIMYVKLAQDRREGSNLLAVTWVDTSEDISAKMWNGTSWVNEPSSVTDNNLERISSSHDIENMDIEFESLSGDLMLVWSNANGTNGTNGARYRMCNGGVAACTWGAVTTPPTFADDATSLDIAANPNTDEIVFASIGNAGGDLQLGYWNGTAWTNTANADTSCTVPYVGSKLVTTGWLINGSTTRSVVVYADLSSGNINWYSGNGGVFTRQPDFTPSSPIASPRGYMEIFMNPRDKSQLMYMTSDNARDLYAKRLIMTGTSTLTWTNSDGGPLETTLPQIISSPFGFAFWHK
jgi:hypothetical protein